ncbi:MAG TPA: iron ABC transporter ATP-binding protein [Pelagibacterium sp.]|uniref:ABC transporter ATP-binding protein n=1 Tax=uncultured Pelagibacterium sp. TaxID=1159875 RepID=UPI000C3CD77A|nr:iron ABC transporter ATP-binding protein [Pelagibacterium sp.]HCO55487.1 iron ABC transporter ATP-binding protein [Pelagibacterium sp.]|tara:strand:- start:16172 stop:16945 length:774 start_codon:yes stop_codon:yes gene_type:complete
MSLAIQSASLTLEGKTILDDVSFALQPGRLNALIGPNGAGKSSLLRVILGFEPGARAHIEFAGADFHALPRRERARVAALVEQTAGTDQPIDVHDVVMLGRLPHQGLWAADSQTGDEEIAARAMARAGVAEFTTRRFSTLSGGEQQRVHIARALAQSPRLLLLDEPTNHLDLSAQIAVMEILRALAREGLTILVTMHDLNLTAAWFDHVVALDRGRVVAQGTPETVIDSAFLARVYGVAATIVPNPASGRPMIAYGP